MLVDPTGTFPKVTAAGLTISVPEGVVSEFGEGVVVEFVEVVELSLTLLMPVHPDWMTTASRSAMNIQIAKVVRLPEWIRVRRIQ